MKQSRIGVIGGVLLFATSAIAQPSVQPHLQQHEVTPLGAKRATTWGRAFFSRYTYQTEGEIDAVLLLSDEQKKKVQAITDNFVATVVGDARLKLQARDGVKPSKEERKAVMVDIAIQMTKAQPKLRERYAGILTDEQKATIARVDAVVQNVVDEVKMVYADRFKAVARDNLGELRRLSEESDRQIYAQAAPKIQQVLTQEQKSALATARKR